MTAARAIPIPGPSNSSGLPLPQSNRSFPLKGNSSEGPARLEKLRQACAEMESVFVSSMIKAMRNAIPNALQKSSGMDLYDSMADQQLAVYLTKGRGMGLGQAIFNQMVRKEKLEDLLAAHPEFGRLNQQKLPPIHGLRLGSRPQETLNQVEKNGRLNGSG